MNCAECGEKKPLIELVAWTKVGREVYCPDCTDKIKRDKKRAALHVILTTTPSIDGRRIAEYLGIESYELVIGTGFFSELTGDLKDFVGGRSKMFEAKLARAKEVAFNNLRLQASEKGADAVVAVDMDYIEFSGNRIGLIVNGTAVKLEPPATAD